MFDRFMLSQEDVNLMKGLNFDAYRFSISWSRIFPGTSNLNQLLHLPELFSLSFTDAFCLILMGMCSVLEQFDRLHVFKKGRISKYQTE